MILPREPCDGMSGRAAAGIADRPTKRAPRKASRIAQKTGTSPLSLSRGDEKRRNL